MGHYDQDYEYEDRKKVVNRPIKKPTKKRQLQFKFPRKLKPDEIIAVDESHALGGGRWSKWRLILSFPPGCEHDAHGIATVNANMREDTRYRLVIFKRTEIL